MQEHVVCFRKLHKENAEVRDNRVCSIRPL